MSLLYPEYDSAIQNPSQSFISINNLKHMLQQIIIKVLRLKLLTLSLFSLPCAGYVYKAANTIFYQTDIYCELFFYSKTSQMHQRLKFIFLE